MDPLLSKVDRKTDDMGLQAIFCVDKALDVCFIVINKFCCHIVRSAFQISFLGRQTSISVEVFSTDSDPLRACVTVIDEVGSNLNDERLFYKSQIQATAEDAAQNVARLRQFDRDMILKNRRDAERY